MGRTRVLFVTCHLPYPPYSGGRRREFELLRRVGRDFDVTVSAVSKVYDEDSANAPALKRYCDDVFVFPATPRAGGVSALPAQVERHTSPELTDHVARAVSSGAFDVVHVEGFYLMQHVPERCALPVLLVEQNVEYVLWRQRAETAVRKHEREAAIAEYLRTLEAETAAWSRADVCGALTAEDAEIMMSAGGPGLDVRLIPDGVDHLPVPQTGASAGRDGVVVFAANFAYQPNVDAALYLCHEIWPRIARRLPHARLLLVGNAPPDEVRALGRRDVVVTGRVPSIDPFLEEASVVVCPLRIGGGVKVKMLEAMSRGRAVVTTSVGAQGLRSFAGRAFLVEDNPSGFAHAVAGLLTDAGARRDLERGARAAAALLPAWDDVASSLGACYRALSGARGRGSLTTTAPPA